MRTRREADSRLQMMGKQTLMIEERGLGLVIDLPHGFSVTTPTSSEDFRKPGKRREGVLGRPLETTGDLLGREIEYICQRTPSVYVFVVVLIRMR